MTSIINNFEITNGLTITDGALKVETNSSNVSLDVNRTITIGSDTAIAGNTKLILRNVEDSTIELYSILDSVIKKNAITNKKGILQFTTEKPTGCLYEFQLGDGNDSVGFRRTTGEIDLAGIVFGKKSSLLETYNVNEYVNSHISYNTLVGNQSLNLTGEQIIFNTSTNNYSTLAQAMIIKPGKIGMFTSPEPRVSLEIGGTDALRIPVGTTGQQPTVLVDGYIRYNTTDNLGFEGYGNGNWGSLGGVTSVNRLVTITADNTNGLNFLTGPDGGSSEGRMRISNDGNVGIGVTDPDEKLEVAGNIKINGNIESNVNSFKNQLGYFPTIGKGATGNYSTAMGYDTTASGSYSTAMGFQTEADGDWGSCAMGSSTIASGTTSTAMGRSTTASGSWTTAMGVYTTASGDRAYAMGQYTKAEGDYSTAIGNGAYTGGNIGFAVGCSSTNGTVAADIAGETNNNNKLVILENGNVGIGTSSPSDKLTIKTSANYQGITIQENINGNTIFKVHDTGVGAAAYFYNQTGSNDATMISGSGDSYFMGGNVGIGTDSPNHKLEVNGDALINGLTVGMGSGNHVGNTAIGIEALQRDVGGHSNVALGGYALAYNTWGSQNTSCGYQALFNNITGYKNTANGYQALSRNTTGHYNTAVGFEALYDNISGSYNVAIGARSGRPATATNLSNTICIGYGSLVNASNQCCIGNDSIAETYLKGNVGIGTTSPGDKLEVSKEDHLRVCIVSRNNDNLIQTTKSAGLWLGATYKITGGKKAAIIASPLTGNAWTDANLVNLHFCVNNEQATGSTHANLDTDATISDSRMVIQPNGNVGIGTDSPLATLNVTNNLPSGDNSTIPSNYGGNSTTTCVLGHGVTGSTPNYWGLNIGTIYSGKSYFQACNNNGSSYDLLLNPNGGNVGIGTDSPGYNLDVDGTMRVTGTITGNATSANYADKVKMSNNAGSGAHSKLTMAIANYGSTGDTLYSPSGWSVPMYKPIENKLYVSYIALSSDRRIKKDIRPMPDALALDILRRLDVKYYKYMREDKNSIHDVIGFIAQEVLDILPGAVTMDKGTIPYLMSDVDVQWENRTDGSYTMTVLSQTLEPGEYNFVMDNEKHLILETMDGATFKTDKKYLKVYVSGKTVDDFHRIDKTKIFAVGYAALQQVDKNQQEEKTKLDEQTSKLTAAETEINTLKNSNAILFNKIATLESNFYNLQQQIQTLISN